MEFQRTLCVLFIIFTGLLSHSEARKFDVGNKDGWVLNPSQDYNTWAGKNRFLISDTLVFKYKKGSDSVLEVSKDDYEKCNTKNPIKKFDDGNTEFTFDRSGPFYFISGKDGNCRKGQKLIVVVLSIRQQTPPKAPSPGSQTPPKAPSPGSQTPPKAPSPGSHPPSVTPSPPMAPSPGSQAPSVPTPSKSPSPVSQPPVAQSPGGNAPSGSPTTPSPTGNTPSASPGVSPAGGPTVMTPPAPSPAGGPTVMTPPAPSPAGGPTAVTPTSSTPGTAPSGAPTATPTTSPLSPGSAGVPAMGPGAPGSPLSSNETTPSSPPGSSAWAITPPSFMMYSVTIVLCAAVGAILGTQ